MTDSDDDADFTGELAAVARFLTLIRNTPFFQALAKPLDDMTRQEAQAYATALGFPDAYPAVLEDWYDAAAAAETLSLDSPAWEQEQQLRRALALEAEAQVDPRVLEVALTRIGQQAQEVLTPAAEEAAAFLGIVDEAFLLAAVGAGVEACHLAALVLATGHDATHPFSLKFSLFEAGRWPIGIIGSSFNIF
ncbi:MAG: hypothetical protein ACFB22_10820 [Rhodothalassiaceae bacterium]